jgi:hypothetical protein
MIGRWDWDIPNDRVYADALVALLFNVDPVSAEAGAPLNAFINGLHPEDQDRTRQLIANSAATGRSYVAEYRVRSADGRTRWVLARGRFILDHVGRPLRGSGLLIDITQSKHDETAYVSDTSPSSDHPLEQAAEHLLAAHQALQNTSEPLLHRMSEMLLLEVGRRLSRPQSDPRRAQMN